MEVDRRALETWELVESLRLLRRIRRLCGKSLNTALECSISAETAKSFSSVMSHVCPPNVFTFNRNLQVKARSFPSKSESWARIDFHWAALPLLRWQCRRWESCCVLCR